MVNQIDQKRPRGRPMLKRRLNMARKDLEVLKPNWNGNLNLVYVPKIRGKLVLEAKSLNDL